MPWRTFLLCFVFLPYLGAQNPVYTAADTAWVERQMAQMSLDQKLGQLFMVAAYSNKGAGHRNEIIRLVEREHVGGLIFFQGTPETQAELTNLYQQKAQIPLMIAMDAEWGLNMRLDKTFKFPWPLTVGALTDTAYAFALGEAMGQHCRRLGVHINFAPVVDLNTNPNNPIINARSFGENPQRVSRLSAAFMRGLHAQKVLACAKHFPGHGDTDSDSHKTLPVVNHPRERLEEIELAPYRSLIPQGLGAVMNAHLQVPALDSTGIPSSLSAPVLHYLRQELGFRGLCFTDALNMGAVADRYAPGEVDLQAFLAGNDVLLFPLDVPLAKEKLRKALANGQISLAQIEARVRKILWAKAWLGLQNKEHIALAGLAKDLQRESDQILNRQIFASAATLLINRQKTLPIQALGGKKFACVTAGTEAGTTFAQTLKKYAQVDHFAYAANREEEIVKALAAYDLVIFGLYTSNGSPWKPYRLDEGLKAFVQRVSLQNDIVLNLFANPYALRDFPQAERAQALLVSYQNHPDAESVAAQIIFGALGAKGRLPVSAGPLFPAGHGLNTSPLGRLGYGLPAEVDMDGQHLRQGIDRVMHEALSQGATPGGQVLVARHGQVVFMENYGYHSYAKKEPVSDQSLYDLASLTKIAATVPLLMKLTEEGKINLDKTLGEYLPELQGSNKADLVIREVLAHQARLKPWIPFYLETLDESGKQKEDWLSSERSFNYPHQLTDEVYSQRYLPDTLFQRIISSDLLPKSEYRYSDLGYYLFQRLIERIEGRPMEELVHEELYRPLGAYTLGYHPLKRFSPEDIVPTEDDRGFRGQLLHGYVHDQGAALLGGVAGHAGLFGNANDLAKLMQMYMQGGHYAGQRYFDSVTVQEFIRCQYCEEENRRGIGFDKPQLEGEGPTCGCLSFQSFGHSGFTGTLAWADPEEEIVYIFLSNRIHPDAANRKLIRLSTRTKIQEVIYEAIHDHAPLTVEYLPLDSPNPKSAMR